MPEVQMLAQPGPSVAPPAAHAGASGGAFGLVEVTEHAAGEGAAVEVDADLLFRGHYARDGADLVLSDAHHRAVVRGYFGGDARPVLRTAEGASLPAATVSALAAASTVRAVAEAGGGEARPEARPIGRVEAAEGGSAVRNGVTVALHAGDPVYKGDVIQTGDGGHLAITFLDGTAFDLDGDARMVVDGMSYRAGAPDNASLFSLVQGAITFVAGQTAKTGDMKVATPTATMGIRGTAVHVEIASDRGTVKFSVMTEPDGHTGRYDVYANDDPGHRLFTVSDPDTITTVTPTGQGQLSVDSAPKTGVEAAHEDALVRSVFAVVAGAQQNPMPPAPAVAPAQPQSAPAASAGSSTAPGLLLPDKAVPSAPAAPATQGTSENHAQAAPAADAAPAVQALQGAEAGGGHDQGAPLAAAMAAVVAATAPAQPAAAEASVPQAAIQHAADAIGAAHPVAPTSEASPSTPAPSNAAAPAAVPAVDGVASPAAGDGQAATLAVATGHGPLVLSDVAAAVAAAGHLAADAAHGLVAAAGDTPGLTVAAAGPAGQAAVAVGAGAVTLTGHYGTLTITADGGYSYSADHAAALAAGATAVDAFTFTAADGAGHAATATLALTVTGAAVAPTPVPPPTPGAGLVLAPDAGVHPLAEAPNTTGSAALLSTTATLAFTDTDHGSHTAAVALTQAVWSGGQALPPGLAAALAGDATVALTEPGPSGAGALTVSFAAPDKTFDFLAAGETLTLTYAAGITDASGATASQPVTVVVTGASDALVFDGPSTITGAIAASALGMSVEHAGGSLHFTDPGLTGQPTASVSAQAVAGLDAAGHALALTPAQLDAVEHAFTVTTAGTNAGTVTWSYDIADGAFAFLTAGQSLTVTSTVLLDDHHGGTATQDVTVTLAGSAPAPPSPPGPGAFAPMPDVAAVQQGGSVAADAAHGVLSNDAGPGSSATLTVFGASGAGSVTVPVSAGHPATITGSYGVLTLAADGSYTYAASNASSLNGPAQDVFTYTASDGQGHTAAQTLTVNVSPPPPAPPAPPDPGHTFTGSPGATLFGDGAPDTFAFVSGYGFSDVSNFDASRDTLQFSHQFFGSAAAVLSSAVDGPRGVVITDAAGDSLTLYGVSKATLAAHADVIHIM